MATSSSSPSPSGSITGGRFQPSGLSARLGAPGLDSETWESSTLILLGAPGPDSRTWESSTFNSLGFGEINPIIGRPPIPLDQPSPPAAPAPASAPRREPSVRIQSRPEPRNPAASGGP